MGEYILTIGDKKEYYKREGNVFYMKPDEKSGYSKPMTVDKLLGRMREKDNNECNREVIDEEVETVVKEYPHLERFKENIYKSFYLRSMILLLTAINAEDKETADLIIEGYNMSERQIEGKRIDHADKITCIGHHFGRLLFRIQNDKEKAMEFYHESGSDLIETKKGYVRLISNEVCESVDQKQEEYLRYIDSALNEREGFCRCHIGIDDFCFRETKISQNPGCPNYLECVIIQRKEENGVPKIQHSTYGTGEVEDVISNYVDTEYGSYSISDLFKEKVEDKIAEELHACLPQISKDKILSLRQHEAAILLYAAKNKKRRMLLKALYMCDLATREECDELSRYDSKIRFIQEHEIYGNNEIQINEVTKRIVCHSMFYRNRIFYDVNVLVDGRRYNSQYTCYKEKYDYDQINNLMIYSDHRNCVLWIDKELDCRFRKVCEEFDSQKKDKK